MRCKRAPRETEKRKILEVDVKLISELANEMVSKLFPPKGIKLEKGLCETIKNEVEKSLIEHCLDRTRGNQIGAAKSMGINRNTFRKRAIGYGVKVSKYTINYVKPAVKAHQRHQALLKKIEQQKMGFALEKLKTQGADKVLVELVEQQYSKMM